LDFQVEHPWTFGYELGTVGRSELVTEIWESLASRNLKLFLLELIRRKYRCRNDGDHRSNLFRDSKGRNKTKEVWSHENKERNRSNWSATLEK
jgi:hypothetical protein